MTCHFLLWKWKVHSSFILFPSSVLKPLHTAHLYLVKSLAVALQDYLISLTDKSRIYFVVFKESFSLHFCLYDFLFSYFLSSPTRPLVLPTSGLKLLWVPSGIPDTNFIFLYTIFLYTIFLYTTKTSNLFQSTVLSPLHHCPARNSCDCQPGAFFCHKAVWTPHFLFLILVGHTLCYLFEKRSR